MALYQKQYILHVVSSGNNYYCAAFIFFVFPAVATSMDFVHWQLFQAIKDGCFFVLLFVCVCFCLFFFGGVGGGMGGRVASWIICLLSGSCCCTLKQKRVASDAAIRLAAIRLFSSESYQNTSRTRISSDMLLYVFPLEKGPGSTPASLEPRIIRQQKGFFLCLILGFC